MNSNGQVFGGFLINPKDGHSYLAKMQQGLRGEWRFILPYTAEAGKGAYLFLFYLGLGHIGRILNIPLPILFHSARIMGAILLLGVLYLFNREMFLEKRHQNIGFAICALGSGLGWIAIFADMFTSDFWVAEAYPFLSMYTNPHFSIGLALMILALMNKVETSAVANFCLGIALGIIQPFAVVIVVLVKMGLIFAKGFEATHKRKWKIDYHDLIPAIAFAGGGGAVLIYQYWSILSDPMLALWNSQNLTVSPGVVDLIISLMPVVVLAGIGVKPAWREDKGRKLVIWAFVSLVLILVPWNLQRRFLTGIYVPLAALALYGLIKLDKRNWLSFRTGAILLLVLAIPTNIVIIASGIQAAVKTDPKIYQDGAIYQGMQWLTENTSPNALVLANEEIGLFIPSITGRRVVYGHPFETINSETEQAFLRAFINADQADIFYERNISSRGIDTIFLSGNASQSLNDWLDANNYKPDFEKGRVRIFQVKHDD